MMTHEQPIQRQTSKRNPVTLPEYSHQRETIQCPTCGAVNGLRIESAMISAMQGSAVMAGDPLALVRISCAACEPNFHIAIHQDGDTVTVSMKR
jgi:hypothetical protein